MADNISEKWLEKAISDEYINYIEYNEFTDGREIGRGAFGTIFKYEWKDCKLTVALKHIEETDKKDKIINELKLCRKVCGHPNIIAFYGVTEDKSGHYNLVLQYANDGNLREYLQKNFIKMQWANKLNIAKEIAQGLTFLHKNNIIHRDLHAKNVLIHQGQPKIADFGLSKQINKSTLVSSSNVPGMPAYTDPKYFNENDYKRNKESDIYSFGVILWEISSGRPPFESVKKETVIIYVSQGKREALVEGTPPQYVELYRKCWDMEPTIRPEAISILETLNQLISDEASNHVSNNLISDELKNASNWNLSCQCLNSEKMTRLVNALCENTNLTSLNLSWNILGTERVKALADALCKNYTLTSLNLKSNRLGFEGIKVLADALCKNTTLAFLNLRENNLGSEGGKELARALCKNMGLTSLNVEKNNFGSVGGKELAKALFKNTTLTSLDLRYNELGSGVGKELAEALCNNNSLTLLDLSFNQLGSEGGKALAKAFSKNTTLTSLNLRSNELGSEGGKALAEALCENTSLTLLDLSFNQLGSDGGKELAKAFSKNTTLTSLNLRSNELGSEGGKELAEALYKNTTLTFLDLENNYIDSETKNSLKKTLVNRNFKLII